MTFPIKRDHLKAVVVALILVLAFTLVPLNSTEPSSVIQQYHIQIWLPIVLAVSIGALGMHIQHMPGGSMASTEPSVVTESSHTNTKSYKPKQAPDNMMELDQSTEVFS